MRHNDGREASEKTVWWGWLKNNNGSEKTTSKMEWDILDLHYRSTRGREVGPKKKPKTKTGVPGRRH